MIYVFMIKRFFIQNGIDYACAILNDEVKVLKTKSSACEYCQTAFDAYKKLSEVNGTYKSDWFTDSSWEIRKKDGSRIVFEIIEKEIL